MNELTTKIVSFFSFDGLELIGLSLFFVIFLIQMFFYFNYYRVPLKEAKRLNKFEPLSMGKYPRVSVIIEAENEVGHLSENLPMVLDQDYPDFEVIVINNGSTDESSELLEQLKLRYSNLYQTFLPHSNDNSYGFRKLAFTIGLKAATGDIVLFTEAYCRPASNQWISEMIRPFSGEKEVVLGYSCYKQSGALYNKMANFDNLFFSLQYLSTAIKANPFTGIYRNVAFKKNLFFDNKGFASHLYLENGEDLFINQIANKSNTTVALSQYSFVETALSRFSLWKQIKKSYSVARSCFKGNVTGIFTFESFSRFLFYGLFAALLVCGVTSENWGLVTASGFLFLLRFLIQGAIVNRASSYFYSGTFRFSLPLFDILQPIYNLRFRSRAHRRIRKR